MFPYHPLLFLFTFEHTQSVSFCHVPGHNSFITYEACIYQENPAIVDVLMDAIKEASHISVFSITVLYSSICYPNNNLHISFPKSVIYNPFPPNFCYFVPQHKLPFFICTIHTKTVLFSVSPNPPQSTNS
jgi:hypothetical protein